MVYFHVIVVAVVVVVVIYASHVGIICATLYQNFHHTIIAK